ncbi:MAG: histidine phosphatase family protein [Candidatus Caccosoma sp.]|nr:histidine phosphatase family protein [Candidatus Caccosoma sp.]
MGTIYLMRHGETLFNLMDVNQGQCDSPLTEKGIKQALKAQSFFKENNIKFDAIYSSSLKRACDTTKLVTDKAPFIECDDLKEISLGIKESKPNKYNPTFPYGDYFVKYGGESIDGFTNRIYNAIFKIATDNKNNTTLIVSHGTVIRCFLMKISNDSKLFDSFIGNCGIVKLSFENDKFTVEDIINVNND